MGTQQNRASFLHAIAADLQVDPELVGTVAKGMRSEAKIRQAVAAYLSHEAPGVDEPVSQQNEETSDETPADAPSTEPQPSEETPKAKKPAKPGLTLSQRRALLRLQDAGSVTPASAFKALPYLHLVDCGYADVDADAATDGVYTLTAEGRDRAASVNPGYRVWSAGETVADDPSRPLAGTRRSGLDIDDLRHVTPVAELPVA
jgi:hypothetical protein